MNIFPSTPLYKAIEKGSIPHAAELKTQLEMYRYGAERLEEAGYYQISNSHWSSNTRERNMYNLHIKDGAEVLAYGSGAGGNLNGFSFTIQKDLEKYKATANSDRKPLDLLFQSDEKQKLRDFITASLEKGRLDTKVFSDRFMISPETKDRLLELINLWKEKGLISKESNGVIWLSISGRFWGPNLISETTELLAPSSRPLPARPNFLKSNS